MSPYGWYQLARVQHDLGRTAETQKVLDHLARFEPKVARQLERETGLRARRCHEPRDDSRAGAQTLPDYCARNRRYTAQAAAGLSAA